MRLRRWGAGAAIGKLETELDASELSIQRLYTCEFSTTRLALSRDLSVFLTGPMRRLPPLNALRVFEVAARTASYAEAGAELGLTHGAVSRQITAVERWLGQRLFVRTGRRMIATPPARAFAAEISL